MAASAEEPLGASDVLEEDESTSTVAAHLRTAIVNSGHLPLIERAVVNAHRVSIYATAAINLLVLRKIEANEELPRLADHGLVNAMFNAVVEGAKARKYTAAQAEVLAAHQSIHGDALVKVKGLAQVVSYLSRDFITSLQTSIKVHYTKRVLAHVKRRMEGLKPAQGKRERQLHAVRVLEVRNDVLRPSYKEPLCREEDRPLVKETRALLGLDGLPWEVVSTTNGKVTRRSLLNIATARPELLLPGLSRLRASKMEAGESGFRLLPMRTVLSPGFVKMDQKVLKQLGLVSTDLKKDVAAKAKERREKQRALRDQIKEKRRRDGEEMKAWAQADRADGAEKPSSGEKERRKRRKEQMKAEVKTMEANPALAECDDGAIDEKSRTMRSVIDPSKSLRKAHADRWDFSFRTDGVSVRFGMRPKKKEGETASSDGGGKRRKTVSDMPTRGLLTVRQLDAALRGEEWRRPDDELPPPVAADGSLVSELDDLAPIEQNEVLNRLLTKCRSVQIVGGDPGKWELLCLSNPDLEWLGRRERDETLGGLDEREVRKYHARRSQRYTLKQRRAATTPGQFFVKKRKSGAEDLADRVEKRSAAKEWRESKLDRPSDVLAAERSLSDFCANGPSAAQLSAYLSARASVLDTLLSHHAASPRAKGDSTSRPTPRELRFKAFIARQRTFSEFCDRIRSMQLQKNVPLVIAYGAAGARLGTASDPTKKGIPSCIGKGLMRQLSRHFVVVLVPEHNTSKRCFRCGGCCGNHLYLSDRDRRAMQDERLDIALQERLSRSETAKGRNAVRAWYERALSHRCEIRGLRFCEGCSRCLNRDGNSAPQMAVQLKRLLAGAGALHKKTASEGRIDRLCGEADLE